MKLRIGSTLFLSIILLFVGTNLAKAQEPAVTFGGGGEYVPTDEISAEERAEIETAIAANREMLSAQGRRSIDPSRTVLLGSPLMRVGESAENAFYSVYNFVDLNNAYPNQHTDYLCGDRSYDSSSGYNHQGIDYFTWPLPWNKMDNDEVAVVAAAPGQIIYKSDGQFDRSCDFGGRWNAVYIEHADGSIAWYGHLKSGSVIAKPIGDFVSMGEQLGIVGSSGSSTGPHLHFELYDHNNQLIEPHAGTCNTTTSASWWIEQEPYYQPTVISAMTGDAPIEMECAVGEKLYKRDAFSQYDEVYFTTFYRDQQKSLPSIYRIYRPDGSLYREWTHAMWADHYAASWWWWSVEVDDQIGTWLFEVEFNGQTVTKLFNVGVAMATTTSAVTAQPPFPALSVTIVISLLLTLTVVQRLRRNDDYAIRKI